MDDWTDISLNVNHLCRICAAHSDVLIPIFSGEGSQHRLDLKIHLYLPIQVQICYIYVWPTMKFWHMFLYHDLFLQVSQDDILPVQVCYGCASTLMSWHGLFLSCQDADHKFRVILGLKGQLEVKYLCPFIYSFSNTFVPLSLIQVFVLTVAATWINPFIFSSVRKFKCCYFTKWFCVFHYISELLTRSAF